MPNCDNCKLECPDDSPVIYMNGPVFFCEACYYGNEMPKVAKPNATNEVAA